MSAIVRTTFALTVLNVASLCTQATPQVDLRFRPTPADKLTVRVRSTLNVSRQVGPQQDEVMNTKTITLAFEPRETAADGTVQIQVRFVAIRVKSGTKGRAPSVDYDSTQPDDSNNLPLAMQYSAFIGAGFPIRVSARGEIVDIGMDTLWLTVAGNYMEREDQAMRQRLGDRADQAIEKMDQRFGSRENRKQAIKKQVSEYPLWDRHRIRALLGNLLVPFPQKPVSERENWIAPIAFDISMPFEIDADYTLKSAENGRCTITVNGQRRSQDGPIVSQVGPAHVSMELAGSCTGTMTVDAKTGLLLNRQAQLKFTGKAQGFDHASQAQPETVQFTMEGTTTVEILK